ncbi:MAG: VCBS repeat-containing protein [Myxococcota bacterium]
MPEKRARVASKETVRRKTIVGLGRAPLSVVGWTLVGLVGSGCQDLPTEAQGTGGDTGSATEPMATTVDESMLADTTATGTDSSAGAGESTSTTSPGTTTEDDASDSSSETTAAPEPLCGDGFVVPTEQCHVLGPAIELTPSPERLAIVDFDEDGALDLLVSNRLSPEVHALWGVGTGDFLAPQLLVTASANVEDLVAADYSGDGTPDLVLTDTPGLRVVSYAGSGDGGLFFAGQYPLPLAPTRLVTGDIDGDGTPDLVAAGNTVATLMRGNGLAGFIPQQDLSMPTGPHYLGLPDLDGNGDLDFVTVNQGRGGNTTCFFNQGTEFGESTIHDTASAPRGLAWGDIDENGTLDLLVTHITGASVGILLGEGAGGIAAQSLLMLEDTDPRSVQLADFDRDGHLDIVVAHFNPGLVVMHMGLGDGTFVPGPRFEVTTPGDLWVDDLNDDEVPDVVIMRPLSGALQVLYSQP